MAQTVKNPPAMQETWVRSLDWEDLLEEGMATHSGILAWRISLDWEISWGMATHSSILAWRIPLDRGAWGAIVHGVEELNTTEATKHSTAL